MGKSLFLMWVITFPTILLPSARGGWDSWEVIAKAKWDGFHPLWWLHETKCLSSLRLASHLQSGLSSFPCCHSLGSAWDCTGESRAHTEWAWGLGWGCVAVAFSSFDLSFFICAFTSKSQQECRKECLSSVHRAIQQALVWIELLSPFPSELHGAISMSVFHF